MKVRKAFGCTAVRLYGGTLNPEQPYSRTVERA